MTLNFHPIFLVQQRSSKLIFLLWPKVSLLVLVTLFQRKWNAMGISRIVDWSNFRLNVENQKNKVIMVTYQNRGIYIYIYINKEPLNTQNENKQTSLKLELPSQIDCGFLSRVTWFLYTLAKPVQSRNSLDSQFETRFNSAQVLGTGRIHFGIWRSTEVFKNLQRSFISSEK